MVTAVAKGVVTITAAAGDKKAECCVTVKKAVESVTLDKTDATLKVGETVALKATVTPADATDKTVAWTSSDTEVAKVDATGKVTAVAPGEAVITATAGDNKTAVCKVTVKMGVESVRIGKAEAIEKVGDADNLKATVIPDGAIVTTVTWTSNNSKVATVDQSGKVTAVAAGEAIITATADGKSAACNVTVKQGVESVSFKRHEVTIETGKTLTLVATISPDDAIVTTATWSSSDTKVATVENGKITAVGAGEAVITATADGKSDSCTVTVKSSVSKVTLDPTEASIEKGKTLQLTATVSPEDAIATTVTWTSSNSKVASVDATGMVTAVEGGVATITATSTANATIKASCKVTVTVPVTGLEVQDENLQPLESGAEIDIFTGNTYDLTAKVLPANATDNTVAWTSSNETVATVDGAGLITTHKAGEAIITAAIAGFSFTAKVVVTDAMVPVTGVTIDQTKAEMKTGETLQLNAKVTPEDADNKEVSWSSSDKKIATVTKGLVTALKAGKVTITATAGGIKASCEITITDIDVTNVTLDQTEVNDLMVGESVTLTAVVGPEDATDKTVTWTSSDENIATVDEEGDVTAVAPGSVTITATAGNVSADCKVTVVARPVPVDDIELSKTQATVVEGGTVTLTAIVHPDEATDKTVTWTSSDEKVATVDAKGVVKAIAAGEAVITAKAGDVTASCKVIVKKAVAGVTLDRTEVTIEKGKTLTLEATVDPADAIETTVIWSSSDEKVATVDQTGMVTAVNGGAAVITAKVGGKTAECKVTVTVPVTSLVVLDEDENPIEEDTVIEIHTGHEYNLTAVVGPDDATDKTVTWTTSDETVIKFLDDEGLIDGLKAGEATVTASIADFSVTVKVKVTDPVIPVTGIKLDKTSAEMLTGETLQLNATLEPEDATSKDITWTSSDNTIASVSTKGLVKALKAGKVTVTATSNKISATCQITISDPFIAVDAITLDRTEATLIEGEAVTLVATVTPDDATDKTVTWTSSDEAVATVDQTGKVTAVKAGEAVITAKAGEKTATCKVTVNAPFIAVDGIKLDKTEAILIEGETMTLVATVTPDDATDKAVTWTSSDEAVATVDQTGKVTAVKAGEAVITAKAGEKTATCKVTVNAPVIEVIEIILNESEVDLKVGETVELVATVTPDDATDKTVTWTSSDETIATVDENGTVTAIGEGNAVITAKAGEKTAECKVNVTGTSAAELIGFNPEAP